MLPPTRFSNAYDAITKIQKLLYYSYGLGDWKDPEGNPHWNGFDELVEIDNILRAHGFGNPREELDEDR